MAGRPTKYNPKLHPVLARWMARCGLTDEQMASELGIGRRTLAAWKGRHPEFAEALREGKAYPDAIVEESLYRRATGYEYEEVQVERLAIETDGEAQEQGAPVRVRRTRKHVVPDTVAQIFWLKNRQPQRWRDKQEHELTGKDGAPLFDVVVVKSPNVDGDGDEANQD